MIIDCFWERYWLTYSIIVIHEFHRDASLEQNFMAAVKLIINCAEFDTRASEQQIIS